MNDDILNTSIPSAAAEGVIFRMQSVAATSKTEADPCTLLRAVGEPMRWRILRELLAGGPLSVLDLLERLGGLQAQMSKHLKVLREAGAVELVPAPDGDGRKSYHAVPEKFRTKEADQTVLDYGVCVLRFP